MARRSQFNGVAHNLVKWSLSRNNDYCGYWAIGQLYSFAIDNNCQEVTLDILGHNIAPETHKFLEIITTHYNIIAQIFNKNGMPLNWLKEVKVHFKFDVEYQDKYHFFGSALGSPMTCTIELVSDLGKSYNFTDGCNIRLHDPKRESCRNAI